MSIEVSTYNEATFLELLVVLNSFNTDYHYA